MTLYYYVIIYNYSNHCTVFDMWMDWISRIMEICYAMLRCLNNKMHLKIKMLWWGGGVEVFKH